MYAAFARREAAVSLLEVRAGAPPTAVEMIERYYRIHGLDRLREQWVTWEMWFTDIEESHTSLAASELLPFAPRRALLDHGGRGRAGRRGADLGRRGCADHSRSCAVHPRRLPGAAQHRRLLRHRLSPCSSLPRSADQHPPHGVRRGLAIVWHRPACRSSQTASRPGATLPAGA